MDFQFAPWERLTSDVVDGDANFSFDELARRPDWLAPGEACRYLVRRCGPTLWLRERKSPPLEWNHWFFCPPVAKNDRPTVEYWDNFFYMLDPVRAETFVHRLWITREKPLAVVLWNSQAGWSFHARFNAQFADESGQPAPDSNWGFQPKLADLQGKPSSEVYRLLQADWNDANSDLSYSARFAQLSELERALLGVQTQIGTPREWASVVAATARACGARWPAGMQSAHLNFCANGAQLRFTCETNPIFGPRENAILGHIMRACQPQQLPDDAALPSALRTLTEGGWSRKFSLDIARPSAHEQLESALELRAWLQTHWPEGLKHLAKIIG